MCVRACACVGVTGGGAEVGAGRSKCGEGLAAVPRASGTCGRGQFGGGAQVSVGVTGQQN